MTWKRNKFNVAPTSARSYKGRVYDSKAEMLYAQRLDLLLQAGEVVDYCEQPRVHICGELWYKPDFLVIEKNDVYYVDVKGMKTDGFNKVKSAWTSRVGIRLVVVKKTSSGFETIEVSDGDSGNVQERNGKEKV